MNLKTLTIAIPLPAGGNTHCHLYKTYEIKKQVYLPFKIQKVQVNISGK